MLLTIWGHTHSHTVTQSKITAGFPKYAHDWVGLTVVFTANTPSYRHQNNRHVECWLWAFKCQNERREYLMAYQAQYGSLLFRFKLKKPLSCPAVSKSTSNVSLCPQKLCGLLGKGRARRPSRLSHWGTELKVSQSKSRFLKKITLNIVDYTTLRTPAHIVPFCNRLI